MNAAEFLRALYGGIDTGVLEVSFIAPDELKLYPRVIVKWRPMPLDDLKYEGSNAERAHVTGKAYVEGRVQAAENWKGE